MSPNIRIVTTFFTLVYKAELFLSILANLGGGNTTYLEVTGGVTIKPPIPKPFAG